MDKSFDAVQMKSEIQQRLIEEFAGMRPDAAREAQRRRIASDPRMARFLKDVPTVDTIRTPRSG